jgi:hypothetical protein
MALIMGLDSLWVMSLTQARRLAPGCEIMGCAERESERIKKPQAVFPWFFERVIYSIIAAFRQCFSPLLPGGTHLK